MDGVKAACFAPPAVAVTRAWGEGWVRELQQSTSAAAPTFTRGREEGKGPEASAWSKRSFPRRAAHHEA